MKKPVQPYLKHLWKLDGPLFCSQVLPAGAAEEAPPLRAKDAGRRPPEPEERAAPEPTKPTAATLLLAVPSVVLAPYPVPILLPVPVPIPIPINIHEKYLKHCLSPRRPTD